VKMKQAVQFITFCILSVLKCSLGFVPTNTNVLISTRSTKCDAIKTNTETINLPDISAEIMTCIPHKDASINKPPLIFIHGSFHASWCWAEHYMPYFAELGNACYALSLRGTGGSFAGEGVKKVKIDEHTEDITAFISHVMKEEENRQGSSIKPVILAHSFGGLLVMKLLEKNLMADGISQGGDVPLSGVALMCSVPPTGNGKMTQRFLFRSLRDSWKITAGLAAKKCITNAELCRELFFDIKTENGCDDNGITDADIERIQGYFKRDSKATIDLVDASKKLPSENVNSNGQALFLEHIPKALVIGAKDDFIVDEEGVQETARYFGVEPIFCDSPHDIMLGNRHTNGAQVIQNWLETL